MATRNVRRQRRLSAPVRQNDWMQYCVEAAELVKRGNLAQAEALLLTVPEHASAYAEVLINLGYIAWLSEKCEKALFLCNRALTLKPDYPQALLNKAGLLQQLGRLEEAVKAYQAFLVVEPGNYLAMNNLGSLLVQINRNSEAEFWFRKSFRIKPDFVNGVSNLGCLLHLQGRNQEALEILQHAMSLDDTHSRMHSHLGNVLYGLGRHREAMLHYTRARDLEPNYVVHHNNIGSLQREFNQLDAAETSYRAAIALDPTNCRTWNNLGMTLLQLGKPNEALVCHQNALALNPNDDWGLTRLALVQTELGLMKEAQETFLRALACNGESLEAYHGALFNQHYLLDKTDEFHLALAKKFGQMVQAKALPFLHKPESKALDRALRIGFVSSDFIAHPISYLLEGVWAAMAPMPVELFAYANQFVEDVMTLRIRRHMNHWRNVIHLSDRDLANLIRQDGIDILVDLSGHTGYSRLPVFAWKPAPVQITWLGYFNTTGVEAVDYILGDAVVTPPGDEHRYVETMWRMPEGYLCCTPPAQRPSLAPSSALLRGFVTFGCFHNVKKINKQVIRCWSGILQAVPGSRLLMKSRGFGSPLTCQGILQQFAEHGIGLDRLQWEGDSPYEEYMAAFDRIDLLLDPFPYPGCTTTLDALMKGVPVLSIKGDGFLGRESNSILFHAGLSTWIAEDEEDYVNKAIQAASDLVGLANWRWTVQEKFWNSPLCDPKRFASNLLLAWQEMWRIWCDSDRNTA
ncbi:MAG: tetratricopeptide repeat protein [Magnetococcales bacterium]|nr:tetratricopeptide repeat protein [Magnetococcales bacterium]